MFSKLLNENNEINLKLYELLKNKSNLLTNKSDDNEGYVVSFGLLTENINFYKVNNLSKSEYVLYPQVFIYDNETKNFVSSISTRLHIPIASELDKKKSINDEAFENYKFLILNPDPVITYNGRCSDKKDIKTSFMNIYSILLDCINLSEINKFNLQIRNIDLGDTGYTNLPFIKNEKDVDALKYMIANIGTAMSSSSTYEDQFFMLPYSKEQSIANVQDRFTNTLNLTVSLPEPDFVIDIKIERTKKKIINENKVEANVGYFIGINYKILEPFSNTVIFDSDFKYAIKIRYPKDLSTNSLNLSDQNNLFFYNRMFEELIFKISSNILIEKLSKDNKKWLKKHSKNSETYNKSLKMHNNIAKTFFNF